MLQANVERLTSTYSANITAAAAAATDGSPSTIIAIGDGVGNDGDRVKDADAVSLASSTHFTMVNGVGGPQRKHKSSLCDRGHQITVLILTMSAVFLIGICGAVFMLESKYTFMHGTSCIKTFQAYRNRVSLSFFSSACSKDDEQQHECAQRMTKKMQTHTHKNTYHIKGAGGTHAGPRLICVMDKFAQ